MPPQHNNKRHSLGASLLISQSLLLNVISVPVTAYIIRTLGPEDYGQWVAASSLIAAGVGLTNPGLGAFFSRAVAQEPEAASSALADQLALRGALALLAGLLLTLLSIALGYPAPVVRCVAISVAGLLLTALTSALSDTLLALGHVKAYSLAAFTAGVVLTATTVLAAGRGVGAVGLTTVYLLGPATQCLLQWVLLRRIFPVRLRWDAARSRALLRQARIVGAKQFLLSTQCRLEQLIVPRMVGIATGAFFFAGSIPASRLMIFPDGLATASYARIARAVREDRESAHRYVYSLMRTSLIICLPMAILVYFLAEPFSRLLFPHAPEMCRTVIRVTIWSLPLQAFVMPMIYTLEASDQAATTARRTIAAVLCGALLSAAMIGRFGLIGACWSWTLRVLIQLVFLLPVFVRLYPLALSTKMIARILLCGTLMVAPLTLAVGLETSALWKLLTGIVSGVILYASSLVLLKVIPVGEIQRLVRRV